MIKIFLIIVILIGSQANTNQKTLKISVFYGSNLKGIEEYLKRVFDHINHAVTEKSYRFSYNTFKVSNSDQFNSVRSLCSELEDGRIAIIGIGLGRLLDHIKYVASALDIPFLSIQWNSIHYEDKLYKDDASITRKAVNIYPSSIQINAAVNELIAYFRWEQITILFQEELGFSGIEEVIDDPKRRESSKLQINVRMLERDHSKWIYLLKDVKMRGSSHFIVHIEPEFINEFVAKAREVGIMTTYYHFIFTTFDLSLLTYAPPANITAFQLYRPNDPFIRNFFSKNISSQTLMSYAVLIYDSLLLIQKTIEENNLVESLLSIHSSVSCQKETVWLLGAEFNKFLRKVNFSGITGEISFDDYTGLRNNSILYIVDMTKNGVELYGYWSQNKSENKSIQVLRSYAREYNSLLEKLDRNLIVTTRLEDPYVMKKIGHGIQFNHENDRYEGYCIELLEKISKIIGFNYTIKLVEDGLYGTQNADGTWNGIVQELIDKKADLAVGAFTITYQREQAIDFTKPFLNLGISILLKRPVKRSPSLFSFLSPLTIDVWFYMIAAYLAVSMILFVLSHLSSKVRKNSQLCDSTSENEFSLLNCLWWTIASLMQQGIELSPKGLSTRLVATVWWFFALIMISSYTANLAAFQTAQRLTSSIEDVDSLSKQTEIKYGSLAGGSTQTFFKEAKIQTYARMWKFMSSNPTVFVNTTDEGLMRVKKGGYAFLLESTMNEYARQRDCDLIQVGGLIDSKGYGIGTPVGSPWTNEVTNAILKLQEDGTLQNLYTKWWKHAKGALKCEAVDDKKKESINELGISNVGGVFLVLACGLIISIIAAIGEFIWNLKKGNIKGEKIKLKPKCCKFRNKKKRNKNIVKERISNESKSDVDVHEV